MKRIAVLVSIAGILGVAALTSATSASAAQVANCNAKLTPKGKGTSTNATLSFVCDAAVRTFGVGSNRPIKSYGPANAGAASAFFSCEGLGVGYGCGILDRAAPGTQTPGTTGWGKTFPPAPAATATPTTCGGFSRTQTNPNRNNIVGEPCMQLIQPGTRVTQALKLKSSPCAGGEGNPFQIYLFVGGEPLVTAIVAGSTLETSTVGEFISPPIKVNLKAYKACGVGAKSEGNSALAAAKKSGVPPSKYPITCSGSVFPRTNPAGPDAKVSFSCTKNIRAFAIYSNKTIVQPGEEPEVVGSNGGSVNEGALHQCEGDIPGPGYGCGIVDRQTQTTQLPNGQGISAGNVATQSMSFEFNACQKPGQPKTKVWVVPMGEPLTSDITVGEFIGAPQPLAVAYGKCKKK